MRALSVGVLAALLLLSGCGNDNSPAAAPSGAPSSMPSKSASPDGYPCLADAGVNQPSSVGHDTEQFVGLTLKEAKKKASKQHLEVRLAGRDGTCYAMTMDYRSDRVNLYVEDDVVVVATIG